LSQGLQSRSSHVGITNARVVTTDRVIEDGHVLIEGDRIAAVGRGPGPASDQSVDAAGRLVVPGFIDLHGDDLEHYRRPREGASVDLERALVDCDRANVAAGITTKFHAVAFENAPTECRSAASARDVTDAISSVEELLGDNRVNARCELGDDGTVAAVREVLDREVVGLVSLMNHLPGGAQFEDDEQFRRRYGPRGTDGHRDVESLRPARRPVSSESPDPATRRLVTAARSAGVPVASHDDESAAAVDEMARLGVTISEFPTTLAAARRATERGLVTAMGAPNLCRGGSLWENLSAAVALEKGSLDALCTDYRPSSLLEAAFAEASEGLPARLARITKAPADALGLTDRGRIEPGARADLVVVDPSPPRVRRVFLAGEQAYQVDPGA
jgi:alpha-D-ribose 1-methylphosphonate 5-triphosphate diphosphatase